MSDADLLALRAIQRVLKDNPPGLAPLDATWVIPRAFLGTIPVADHPAELFLNAEGRFVRLAMRETALPVDLAFLEIMG